MAKALRVEIILIAELTAQKTSGLALSVTTHQSRFISF